MACIAKLRFPIGYLRQYKACGVPDGTSRLLWQNHNQAVAQKFVYPCASFTCFVVWVLIFRDVLSCFRLQFQTKTSDWTTILEQVMDINSCHTLASAILVQFRRNHLEMTLRMQNCRLKHKENMHAYTVSTSINNRGYEQVHTFLCWTTHLTVSSADTFLRPFARVAASGK